MTEKSMYAFEEKQATFEVLFNCLKMGVSVPGGRNWFFILKDLFKAYKFNSIENS